MKDSLDVLSVGRRCVDMGYEFHWPTGSTRPYFVTPDGSHVEIEVGNFIPFLDATSSPISPAMSAPAQVEHDLHLSAPARDSGSNEVPPNAEAMPSADSIDASARGGAAEPDEEPVEGERPDVVPEPRRD